MANIKYDLVALSVTLWFNKYGDHDHNGLIYILQEHQDIIKYIKDLQDKNLCPDTPEWQCLMNRRNELINKLLRNNTTIDKFILEGRIEEWFPSTKEKARQPHPLIVPLVLRASLGDTITINLKNEIEIEKENNEIEHRQVGIHLVGPGTDSKNDGSHIGKNQSSLVSYSTLR